MYLGLASPPRAPMTAKPQQLAGWQQLAGCTAAACILSSMVAYAVFQADAEIGYCTCRPSPPSNHHATVEGGACRAAYARDFSQGAQ